MNVSTINIGVLAHVDAGKTTLTEQLLFQSGALRTVGSVDKGTSSTDHLNVEKERGISVRSATATLFYKDTKINIIDTPGHVDFCAEVEYGLRAMDAVILVVSAVEGVQGHTLSLFEAIQALHIPCLIFINKIDRMGAASDSVTKDIVKLLSPHCIALQDVINEAEANANIKSKWDESLFNAKQSESIIETIADYDDDLMAAYLEGNKLSFKQVNAILETCISRAQLIPILSGIAKNGTGILALLDAIVEFFAGVNGDINKALSAVVFKIEHDKSLGKMAYLRVFNGVIKARDVLVNASRTLDKDQKAGQLKTLSQGKYSDIDKIVAGDIGVVSGLSAAKVGDVYGVSDDVPKMFSLATPMLTVQVKPIEESQIMSLVQAVSQLCDEDPVLDSQWITEIRELHLKITGTIQIEILQAVLLERYELQVEFSEPSVIYKETPKKLAYGYERYWMPKPCWAILKLRIEPAELGSGVSYSSELSVNDVAAKYQKEIEQCMHTALAQGIKGWQVTDCKITLVEGQDHNIHSRSGDFLIATPMAVINGLVESGTTLLEPILSFYLSASVDLLGTISSDIIKMRGSYESPIIEQDQFILRGKVPAATSIKYPITLASISAGKAKYSSKLYAYEPCTDEQGHSREYRGVSPLDRDKWILQARGALL
jgi:ribosomal protection tetracycline resistance protein